MSEDLLGYLLGALDPDEMDRVERMLQSDPELRDELRRIEASLRPLEDGFDAVEPPPIDLVARTLDALPPMGAADPHAESVDSPLAENLFADAANTGLGDEAGSSNKAGTVRLSPTEERIASGGWRWQDWFAASMSAAVVLALILPAVANGRFEARKVACQNQLRSLGMAITQFVSRQEQNRLPAVHETGPEAHAGVFAVRLNEAGLLDDGSVRWCPSFDLPLLTSDQDIADASSQVVQGVGISPESPTIPVASMASFLQDIPRLEDLHAASVDRLRRLQQITGGNYAYILGVRDGGHLRPPRYEHRAGFAIMSDAPLAGRWGNGGPTELWGHGGRGLNVLYEDGHVRFVTVGSFETVVDDPWVNHRGHVEAGITPDDSVLGPSWRGPFLDTHQR
ncbi:hypothetical protein [Crateriforma spongiae]|uniref:hypothetical protein n=1 Tax=Crateriforma spongiae TaxID=2724528 RepID=UPI0014484398|nr:hypothetical protein [Crateriforma spongiae]